MRITSLVLLCLVVCLAAVSCDGDKITPPDETVSAEFKNLENKDDVLFNLELAYNERDTKEVEKLLGENFTFVFSREDHTSGYTPQHWGEAGEIDANRKILDPNLSGDKRVTSIDLSFDYPEDNWTEETSNLDHPGESWYTQTIGYSFTVKTASDWEYRASAMQALFKIRWDEPSGRWRVAEWSDISDSKLSSAPSGVAGEESSWGILKAQYSDRPYEDLTSKDDVLYNLEFSYNRRSYAEFEKLLGDFFIFIFSESDWNRGEVDVPQWDRPSELAANQKILDPNLPGGKRVISIDLRLDFPAASWVEEPPAGHHPDESWFTKTVDYNLITKTADDWEHRATGVRAQFTIRWDEPAGAWQIVLWRDDVGYMMALSPGGGAVEETTWGGIKAMYN